MQLEGKKGWWVGRRVVSWHVRVDDTTVGLESLVFGKYGCKPAYEGG